MINVNKQDILCGLKQLGLGKGNYLVAHSSLKSFGHVEGGAQTVIEALLEAVGPDGLFLMPTYAFNTDDNGDLMPLDQTKARITTGAIPTAFARHNQAYRGHHPLYSITFAGNGAKELAEENSKFMFPYGKDQQFSVVLRPGGYMLLLGVGDKSNSSIHMLEEICDPAYLGEKKSVSRLTVREFFAMSLQERREALKRHRAGPRRDYNRITELLAKHGLSRQICIGKSRVTLEPALELLSLLKQEMKKDMNFLVTD